MTEESSLSAFSRSVSNNHQLWRVRAYGYIVLMKSAPLVVIVGLLMASPARAQNQASGPNGAAEKNPVAQSKQALSFVKTAAVVADHVRHRWLNNYFGLYISPENWALASKDDYVGPFLRVKYAKPKAGRSIACVFSPDKDIALCVYFDGETPFGLATVKVGVSGRVDPYKVASSYEGLATRLLRDPEQKLEFVPADASTDDGQSLPGFMIKARTVSK